MDNSYFTNVKPYFAQQTPQDQQGLMPLFQNMASQQANQNAAMQQSNALTQGAGDAFKQSSGMNPMAMAAMLRKKTPDYDAYKTSGDMTYFGNNSNGMGAGQGYAGMNTELGL